MKILKHVERIVLDRKNESPTILATTLGVSRQYIYNILKKHGVSTKVNRFNFCRKYEVDIDFFKFINTPEKAYFLGWLYSDGYVSIKGGYFGIQLQEKDKLVLILLSRLLGSTRPLAYRVKDKSDSNRQNQWSLQIKRKEMVDDLVRLGLSNDKSAISFPDYLPEHLIRFFVRGFFDGDGNINVILKKNRVFDFSVSCVCCRPFAKGLIRCLAQMNIPVRIQSKSNSQKVIDVAIRYQKNMKKFLNWMYDGRLDLKLVRKYGKSCLIRNHTIRRKYYAKEN